MVICKAQMGSSWNLVFYKMDDVQLRNWFSVMFTALEIVFSCTFCILKPFIGVQCSLHKYKGKKSQQFRLLSYSAEIINGDRSTVSLKSAWVFLCIGLVWSPSLCAKVKGTLAFKKSTWLGTFVYFTEERVEFQIPFEASVQHPRMGAKDIPRCLLSSGQLTCPRCAWKVGRSPFKSQAWVFVWGPPAPYCPLRILQCSPSKQPVIFAICYSLCQARGGLASLGGTTPGTMWPRRSVSWGLGPALSATLPPTRRDRG